MAIKKSKINRMPAAQVCLEETDQEALVFYLEYLNLKFTSIPNSTFTKSKKQKIKNRKQGLRKGLPDLLVIIKGKLVFIEMKKKVGGVVSVEQKEWINELNCLDNVYAHVCRGFDEAKAVVNKYYY